MAVSFAEAPRRAAALGCDCFQIFAGPPRSFSRRMPSDAEAADFRAAVREHGLRPVVVHAGYLLHLVSAKPRIARGSVGLMRRELEIARRLGAGFYVLHPGSAAGRDRDDVLARLARAIGRGTECLDRAGPVVLLENVASVRTGLGASFEELARLLDLLDEAPDAWRYGVVLDTAHAVGAGYDLTSEAGVRESLRALFSAVGRGRVRLVHANDTKVETGSGRDLHDDVGRGRIGRHGFAALLRDRTIAELPFILETPIRREGDDARNLRALRRIASQAGVPGDRRRAK
jgi:deoxyribonuclease-4